MLQHISDVGGAVPERLPVQIYLSVLRGDEAADNGQQGRFADGAAAATLCKQPVQESYCLSFNWASSRYMVGTLQLRISAIR